MPQQEQAQPFPANQFEGPKVGQIIGAPEPLIDDGSTQPGLLEITPGPAEQPQPQPERVLTPPTPPEEPPTSGNSLGSPLGGFDNRMPQTGDKIPGQTATGQLESYLPVQNETGEQNDLGSKAA